MPRLTELFTLANPIIVRHDDRPVVVLAFGLTARGWIGRGGVPVALCIDTAGGVTRWLPIHELTFPAPIQPSRPDKPARANAGQRTVTVLQ